MSVPTSKIPAGCILVMITLTTYLLTLCPTVYVGDSGELSAAAFCLGVPHGSGYPLYVLVGKAFCLLPFGDVGFRMNLMSAVFGALAVGGVYSLIRRMSGSRVGAWVGGGVLAFLPVFWWQGIAAEVYTLHVFFVTWMVWLLWRWDESREFRVLVGFAFVTGLSFGNHLQTVMLAPAVFYLILSGDRKVLLDGKRFLLLFLFFVLPLLAYLYLPIRTWAGAAIHWGDPDSWDRFWAHVSGRSHRGGYVFNLGIEGYAERFKESLEFLWGQFGVMSLVGLWGWWRIRILRFRVFFLGVVVFDLFYTVFLNTISLQITPFNLSACVVSAVGIGIGVAEGVRRCEERAARVMRVLKVGCGLIPLMFLVLNYPISDQSENYTAYEHAANILRTVKKDSTLIMSGDNYIFPLTYARLVERAREDICLFDRLNVIFKQPQSNPGFLEGKNEVVFYALYGPSAADLPEGYRLIPYGVVFRSMEKDTQIERMETENLWKYYSVESFYDQFQRDFMAREVSAFYYFCRGKSYILSGQASRGFEYLRKASETGSDSTLVHSEMGVFLTELGYYRDARKSLEKALEYHEDLGGAYNNLGYYYHKTGNLEMAISSFRKAVQTNPDKYTFLSNLGLALLENGNKEEALRILQRSLAIQENQPRIKGLIEEIHRVKHE